MVSTTTSTKIQTSLLRFLFWSNSAACSITRYSLHTKKTTALLTKNTDCPDGLDVDTLEERIYWFTPTPPKTLHSFRYNGTDKRTHYADGNMFTYTYTLMRVEKLLYWGGYNFCMKFYDLPSNTAHHVNCSQSRLVSFAHYKKGAWLVLYIKVPL